MGKILKLKWLFLVAVAAILAVGSYMISDMGGQPKSELDQSRTRTTEKGVFVVAIEPEVSDVKLGEIHSWIVTVTTPDGQPVEDASIEIGGGMPEHNHGLPTSPQMTQKLGEGRYRIEGVKFSMRGWWEMRFKVSAGTEADSVTFNIVM